MHRLAIIAPLLAVGVVTARAADQQAPDAAAMAAAMEQMSKTGPEHAALAKDVGAWDVASTFVMPGMPEQHGTGKATYAMILDGKWQRLDFQGDMMGHPFSGLGLMGYDTVEKKWVGSWVDSMGTKLTTMTGESADGGKTVTYHSHMDVCPMTGGPVDTRSVLAHDGADTITFTAYDTMAGAPEMKSMELVYTRAAK